MPYNPLRLLHHSAVADMARRTKGRRWPASCPAGAPPLKVRGNLQGLGNRIGWYLTAAAVTEALGRSALYTSWPSAASQGVRGQGARDYDFGLVRQLVHFPAVVHFLEDVETHSSASSFRTREAWLKADSSVPIRLANGSGLYAESIPFHPRPYVNDYVPECAWAMLEGWTKRRLTRLPVGCIARDAFLHAYRRVQSELRPRLPLCNPPPRSYVVLHIRRGDKAAWAERTERLGRRDKLAEQLANATSLRQLIPTVLARIPAPFLVLTDAGVTYRQWVESELVGAGLRVWTRRCEAACEASSGCWTGGGRNDSVTPVAVDFFAILDAAGVVVVAPKGVGPGQGLQESSFASVPALAGGAPHLTPVPYAMGGKMAMYQERGNGGRPLAGIFFLEGLHDFVRSVRFKLDPTAARCGKGKGKGNARPGCVTTRSTT